MSRPAEILSDYVLGLLSPDKAQALEAHLKACKACQQEVYGLQKTFYALPDALTLQAPPEDAWRKLQARRHTTPRPQLYPDHPTPRRSAGRWAAAAVFLVLLSGSFWGLEQNQKFRQLEAEQKVLTAWMNNPELTIRPLSTDAAAFPGILCTYPDGRALLVQKEDPPRGLVYRAWGVNGTSRTMLGSTTSRILRLRSEGFSALEVSLEPRRSSEQEGPTQIIGRVSL